MALLNHSYYSFFFILFSTSLVLPFITSLPLPESDSPYDKFIDFLSENNCTMPKEIKLPFSGSSDPSPFSYLSTPLNECRTMDAMKENDEAYLLCAEVFYVLQNIMCFESSKPLPTIDSSHLSENICPDFNTMRNIFPKRNDFLSGKLVDPIICKIMCTQAKYKLLCQTLLWSYDTQSKMNNALENEDKETVKEHIDLGASDKGPTPIKVSLVQNKLDSKDQEHNKEANKFTSVDITHTKDKNSLDGANLKNLESSDKKVSSETTSQMSSTKAYSLTSKIQVVSLPKTEKVTTSPQNESINEKLSQEVEGNKNVKPVKSNSLSYPNLQDTHIADNKNEINVGEQSEKVIVDNVEKGSSTNGNFEKGSSTNGNVEKSSSPNGDVEKGSSPSGVVEKVSSPNGVVEKSSGTNGDIEKSTGVNGKDLSSINNGIKGNEDNKNISESISQNKNNVNSDINTKASGKSEETIIPNTEMDNELNNDNLQDQENETKPKPADVKNPDDKDNVEQPKLTDFENEVPPDIESKLSESSTVQINPDEEGEQHQDDKEQEQYNDTENEGDYSKADYDNSFNLLPKSREPDVKSSIIAGSSQLSNNYDSYMNQRKNIGRIPDVVPNFPEQENGNFFFYFLSIVLILMAGYLIFHNKQKIIALIVEGRHERRRRSHGAGYKKLETK